MFALHRGSVVLGEDQVLMALTSARGAPPKAMCSAGVWLPAQGPFHANGQLPETGLSKVAQAGKLAPPDAHHFCSHSETQVFDLGFPKGCT